MELGAKDPVLVDDELMTDEHHVPMATCRAYYCRRLFPGSISIPYYTVPIGYMDDHPR
jgi:hypothetical protein